MKITQVTKDVKPDLDTVPLPRKLRKILKPAPILDIRHEEESEEFSAYLEALKDYDPGLYGKIKNLD